MKRLRHWFVVCTAGLLALLSVRAQPALPDALSQQVPFFAAALSEMISDSRSFTASAELRFQGASAADTFSLPFGVALRDGRMRWQLNLDQLRGGAIDPEMIGMLRDMRLDRVILILRPHTNAIIAFPGTQAYAELPISGIGPLQEEAQRKVGFLQKTLLGPDVLEGRPAMKYKLTVSKDAGKSTIPEEAVVWQVPSLKDMPVKLVVRSKNDVYGLQFREIRQGEPDARLFEAPAGYTRHDSVQALLQSALMKNLAGNGGPTLNLKSILGALE
jgi:hypothetical protein